MINWTQKGAGLSNAGITPSQLQSYYGTALQNYRAAQQPAPTIGNDVITQRAQANRLTRLSNPFDLSSKVVAAKPMVGNQTPIANQIAAHRNAVTGSMPITTLSGWMEKQGLGNSTQIANNISKQGLAPVQQYLAPARDWELRETVRSNVQKGGGIVGMGLQAAPYIMSYAAGGFANPFSFGGAGGGLLKSLPGRAISGYTTPAGLAQKAQGAIMSRVRRRG